MYDLKPLEEEWERYHKRKRLPFYVGFFAGFLILLGTVLFFNSNKFSKNKIEKTVTVVETNNHNVMEKDRKIKNISKEIVIDEISNFTVKKEVKNNKPIEMIVDDIPILEEELIEKKPIKDVQKKVQINIIETTSMDAYQDVENRFFQLKNVDDSLFLAKSYYKKGKYKKSEFWALQTNKINSTIDESWIIFAKSKVKLGQKNEAMNILSSYIKRTGSERAKNILLKIKFSK